ncbi:MAG: hypothetical protein IH851_11970 [Armatimonadetes bacterium]|nr:hypothetical protein [Armatimonadota bacterium]
MPRVLKVLVALTVVGGVAALLLAVRATAWGESPGGFVELYFPYFGENPSADSFWFLIAGVLGILGGWLLTRRSSKARWVVLAFWTFGLAIAHYFLADYLVPSAVKGLIRIEGFHLDLPQEVWRLAVFSAFFLPVVAVFRMLFGPRTTAWLGGKREEQAAFETGALEGTRRSRRWPLARLALLALALWWMLDFATPWTLLDYVWASTFSSAASAFFGSGDWVAPMALTLTHEAATGVRWVFGWISLPIPFAAAAGLLVWRLTERLIVDEQGIRLCLFDRGATLYFAPWKRVRKLHLIRHKHQARTVVVHYRTRFFLPFALGVHARRYRNGDEAVTHLLEKANERGIPVRSWKSPESAVWAGWACILAAAGLVIFKLHYHNSLMTAYAEGAITLEQFGRIPQPALTGALHAAAICLFGLGLGLFSAFHRAAGRPFLLALFLIASVTLPDPVIMWHIWFALYAILTARLGPVTQVEPVWGIPIPALWEWNVGITLVFLGPVFAALGYYVGLGLGKRRLRFAQAQVGADAA